MHCFSHWRLVLCSICFSLAWFSLTPGYALAGEPSLEQLGELRSEAKFEQAMGLIDAWEARDDLSPDLREVLDYQRGLTLMAQSRQIGGMMNRASSLDAAQRHFEKFMHAHPKHALAIAARSELANIDVERARMTLVEAKRQDDADEKQELLAEARGHYDQAREAFNEALEGAKVKLIGFPKALDPARDGDKIRQRDRLRADYVKIQMVVAVLLHERAETFADKAQRNAALKEAADAYGELYEKYRRRLAGLYARLQQAKCLREMGEREEAISLYQDVVEQPTEPAPLRALHTKALAGLLETLAKTGHDKTAKAIENALRWIAGQQPAEKQDPDWLALHLAVAQAYQSLAAQPKNAKRRDELLAQAENKAKVAASAAWVGRVEAQKLVFMLSKTTPSPMEKDAATFEEAFALGRQLMRQISFKEAVMLGIEERLKEDLPADRARALRDEYAHVRSQWVSQQSAARRHFEQCLELAGAETPAKEIHNARYYLTRSLYQQKRYEQAIEAGMPTVKDAPEHAVAGHVAMMVHVSHVHLLNAAEDAAARRKHAQALFELHKRITANWPESDIANRSAESLKKVKELLRADVEPAVP